MTIVTLNPAVDGDDIGLEAAGIGYFSAGSIGFAMGYSAYDLTGAVRFPSTGIPQGATISSALFQMATPTLTGASPYSTAYGENVDAPVAFGSGSLPSSRLAANPTSATATVESGNYTSIDVTSIVQEIVNRPGFGGTLALLFDAISPGSYVQDTSSTLTDYDLVVDYTAGSGTSVSLEAGSYSLTGNAATITTPEPTPAFAVQHLTPTDIGTSGGTLSPTAVSSLSSAIALNINSRYIGGGPDGSAAASINVDDAAMGVRFTATNTVTIDRESAASGDNRASVAVWEYIGASGGDNEFIVRDRRTITLSSSNSSSFTPSGISDAAAVIPIITGIRHDNTGTSHGYLTAACTINRSTGEVTAYGRGGTGTAVIEITTVEFPGANWTVHYGATTNSGDTGTITLNASVSDWANSWIIHQFWKGSAPTNHAISDVTPTYVPGASANQVDWAFHGDHDGETDQLHVAYVLENASMEVTRFTSSDSSAGNVNIDITSAGLTDVAEALVWVSASTSGTGTVHLRGTRNAQITSTTQAQHYAHRSGNTVDVRLQVINLPQDPPASSDVSVPLGAGSYALTGNALGITEATGVDLAAGSYALTGLALDISEQVPLALASGSYAISGAALGLSFDVAAALNAGSFVLTGNAISIASETAVDFGVGAYSLTGLDLSIAEGVNVDLGIGSYSLTGLDLAASVAVDVSLDAGSYSLTGLNLSAYAQRPVALVAGSYVLTGFDLGTTFDRAASLGLGSYSLTGLDIDVSDTLNASVDLDAGSYALSGLDLSASLAFDIGLEAGSYSLTGFDLTSSQETALSLDAGAYALSGLDIGISVVDIEPVPLAAGSYSFTGYDLDVILPKQITGTLVSCQGSAQSNLTLISWAWFDETDPVSFGAPTDQGEVETTTSTGAFLIKLPNTSLDTGEQGTLVLRSDDGSLFGAYNLAVQ